MIQSKIKECSVDPIRGIRSGVNGAEASESIVLACKSRESFRSQRPEVAVITSCIDAITVFPSNPSTQLLFPGYREDVCQVSRATEEYYGRYNRYASFQGAIVVESAHRTALFSQPRPTNSVWHQVYRLQLVNTSLLRSILEYLIDFGIDYKWGIILSLSC